MTLKVETPNYTAGTRSITSSASTPMAATTIPTTSTTAYTIPAQRLNLALTLLRVVAGVIFTAHGGQKLFVYGFEGVSGAFAQMGVPMAGVMGPFVALVEFFGGLALVVGLLTRLAAFGLAITM